MIKDMSTLSMVDILPDNLLADEKIYATAKALDKELQLVTADCKQVMHLSRLDELPEPVVDLLAWQWHVDFYEAGMDLPTKRRMVKQSIAWHRRKGTPWAVEEVATAVFGEAIVAEWFDYNAPAYHFKINLLDAPGVSQDKLDTIVRLVKTAKNERSVLDGLGVKRKTTNKMYMGVYPKAFKAYHVGPTQVHDTNVTNNQYMATVPHIHKSYHAGPAVISDAATTCRSYTGGGPYVYKSYKV